MSFDRRAYMRRYMARRYQKMRREIVERLGGECAECGATNPLEIDHVDRAEKTFSFTRLHTVSRATLDAELENAQLLCEPCHQIKSQEERGNTIRSQRLLDHMEAA